MDEIEEFVDERQKSWCIHCGGWIDELESTKDHVPTKSLLREPYPGNLPIVRVCKACNKGFSPDEQYLVAFLGAVLCGTTEPERQSHPAAGRILRWNSAMREEIEKSKTTYETRGGEPRTIWAPDLKRVNRALIKNARGHAFFEYGEPIMESPEHVWAAPIALLSDQQWSDFENLEGFNSVAAWPEVGSRMMTRVVTGQDLDGQWVIVQDGVYRYALAQQDRMLVRTVIYEYLATEVFWS